MEQGTWSRKAAWSWYREGRDSAPAGRDSSTRQRASMYASRQGDRYISGQLQSKPSRSIRRTCRSLMEN